MRATLHLRFQWQMEVYAMASIREINGKLFFDFRYKGQRCREYTAAKDNKINRANMEKILKKIEDEIAAGTFEYRKYFPDSKLAKKLENRPVPSTLSVDVSLNANYAIKTGTPLFKVFSEQWFIEFSIDWRRSYKATVRQILDSR